MKQAIKILKIVRNQATTTAEDELRKAIRFPTVSAMALLSLADNGGKLKIGDIGNPHGFHADSSTMTRLAEKGLVTMIFGEKFHLWKVSPEGDALAAKISACIMALATGAKQ